MTTRASSAVWCSFRPGSSRCRSPKRYTNTAASSACAYYRSTVAKRCSSSCGLSSAASTLSWRPLAERSITSGDARWSWMPWRWSCWTKRTRCSTWDSPRTSRPFSTLFRRRAKRHSSRPRWQRRFAQSQRGTCAIQSWSRSRASKLFPASHPDSAKLRSSSNAGIRLPRWHACSIWRHPRLQSYSVELVPKSTS